jgi:hypothetical protein
MRLDLGINVVRRAAPAFNVELIPDPSFDNPLAWTESHAETSVSGGAAHFVGTTANRSILVEPVLRLVPGGIYTVTIEIANRVAGGARINGGGFPTTNFSANGVFTNTYTATTTGQMSVLAPTGTTLDVVYASIKRIG